MVGVIQEVKYHVKICRIGIIVCSILNVAVYIRSALNASEEGFFESDIGLYDIFKYAYLIALCVGASLILRKAMTKKYLVIAAVGVLTLYYLIITKVLYHNGLYAMEELCLSLWPLGTYLLAENVIKLNRNRDKLSHFLAIGIYFCVVQVAIFFVQDILVSSEFFRRDPIETFFMIVVGIFSWITVEKRYSIQISKTACGVCSILSVLVTFWNHKRISNIIGSLVNPISSGYTGNLCSDNWIGYRINLAWNAWFGGDISPLGLYPSINSPLFWIKYRNGWFPFFVAVVSGVVLLYFVVIIMKKTSIDKIPLIKFLLLASIFRWTLGYLAEMFLITSTNIGMLLVRNPGDILVLWILAFWDLKGGSAQTQTSEKT